MKEGYIEDVNIVVIGMAADKISPFERFFSTIEENTGLAYVVLQDLALGYEGLSQKLLAQYTTMEVIELKDNIDIEVNKIYLVPPTRHICIQDNRIYLEKQIIKTDMELAFDLCFTAVGQAKKNQAVGILLAGTKGAGHRGLQTIKNNGGMTIMDSEDAELGRVIEEVELGQKVIDLMLSPDKMLECIRNHMRTLAAYKQNYLDVTEEYPSIGSSCDLEEEWDKLFEEDTEEAFNKIVLLVKNYTGVDFMDYKKNTIIRRIERRMGILNIETMKQYIQYIHQNLTEINTLYNEIFIGVTNFLRDIDAFLAIKEKVIPTVFENKAPGTMIRIWSAGCSTGEEVYSLAILIREYMELTGKFNNVKIFATDLDSQALSIASSGIYKKESLEGLSEERIEKFFVRKGDMYQVSRNIRDMIIFAKHNIIKDPPFSKLDLIVCRNLLIYLKARIQQEIFSIFHFALNSKGFIFLGSSENMGTMGKYFNVIDSKWRIYQVVEAMKDVKGNVLQVKMLDDYYKEKNTYYKAERKRWTSSSKDKFTEKIVKDLQEYYVPNGVIIDEQYELIHILGDVNRYIRFPSNRISLNLLKMIRKDLSVAVGTAIYNVFKDQTIFKYKNIQIRDDEGCHELSLTVKPYIDETYDKVFAVVLFEEICDVQETVQEESFQFQDKVYERIAALEHELKFSKEHLQAAIEELESSNEELQSTNEELVSSNEELQSTNEELQSVNEELYTVNAEYHQKISELTQANDDINNLLEMTDISAIFLDKHLCIRRFTPTVRKTINLIHTDIGRPLTDIAIQLQYAELIEDIQWVMAELRPIERLIKGTTRGYYKIAITPYASQDNYAKGAVIHILDITDVYEITG